jgi:hypothetical protein
VDGSVVVVAADGSVVTGVCAVSVVEGDADDSEVVVVGDDTVLITPLKCKVRIITRIITRGTRIFVIDMTPVSFQLISPDTRL